MNEKLRIELCSDTRLGKEPFYAELELPATAEQIRDAKQRARIVSADDAGSVSISIIEFGPIPELEEVRLDTTTVEELNFLAMRMDALCEEQFLVYRALFDKRFEDMGSDGLLSVKDLINMTYGIDDVVVASGIDTDEQLGQFVIETAFFSTARDSTTAPPSSMTALPAFCSRSRRMSSSIWASLPYGGFKRTETSAAHGCRIMFPIGLEASRTYLHRMKMPAKARTATKGYCSNE